MNTLMLKIAVSPLVIAVVGCSTIDMAPRAAAASEAHAQSASRLYYKARKEVAADNMAGALDLAERAVESSPRDLAYRMLLGDLYLKNGRFLSAEMAFNDVLRLDATNARAQFSLALAEIAQGKGYEAEARLEALTGTAPADVGLAFALAGQPERAIALLEPAARTPGAAARVRQNLALAYAIAGDWQRAEVTAAQDLSPAELPARLQQWASFVRPNAPADQVAAMLGVTPVADQGQPIRLALVQPQAETAYAEAEIVLPEAPVTEAPVEYAAAEYAPQPVAAEPDYVAAVETLSAPRPVEVAAAEPKIVPAYQPVPAPAPAKRGDRFVVQLASYSSAAGLDAGWNQLRKRYALSGNAYGATVNLPGRGRFHRLSVGYGNQRDALAACRSIKARGGACFVRANAGDQPLSVRFASKG